MPVTLGGVDVDGLERSCERIRFGPAAPGLQRAEVVLRASRYEPHRHDTYALGITLRGVQAFGYRGARRICLAGQAHVLHPDELHDGAAATPDGLGYRIVYVATELVRDALGARALPFVADPVQPVTAPLAAALGHLDAALDGLAASGVVAGLADSLLALAGRAPHTETVALRAVQRVREHLAAH